jgi:hypothetical protein
MTDDIDDMMKDLAALKPRLDRMVEAGGFDDAVKSRLNALRKVLKDFSDLERTQRQMIRSEGL